MKCERCKKEDHLVENCHGCKRGICRACNKSSKHKHDNKRAVICKDCWGNIPKRTAFKSC